MYNSEGRTVSVHPFEWHDVHVQAARTLSIDTKVTTDKKNIRTIWPRDDRKACVTMFTGTQSICYTLNPI